MGIANNRRIIEEGCVGLVIDTSRILLAKVQIPVEAIWTVKYIGNWPLPGMDVVYIALLGDSSGPFKTLGTGLKIRYPPG